MKGEPVQTLSTGYPSIDAYLGGGIRRGDLVTLGGDVGSGKSALALSMALRAARGGARVAFHSGEMRPERVRERMLSMEQRVSIEQLRRDKAGPDGESAAGLEITFVTDDEPEIKWASPGAGVDALVAEIRAAEELDLAVIDHLQAFVSDRTTLDEELASAVRKLKAAAVDSQTAVLLVAHCNVDRSTIPVPRPALAHFGALGAVNQHSDAVLGLYREEMYENARGIDGAAELHVLKNRHGVTGYVDLYFYKQWLRFEDMVEP